jgi:hypothetical protein
MREVRVQVFLHPQAGWEWPFAEAETHWYALGMHPDLNEACAIALRKALDFLEREAGLSRPDTYGLASLAVSFRLTRVVDANKGVHAMLPKSLFSDELRESISSVSPDAAGRCAPGVRGLAQTDAAMTRPGRALAERRGDPRGAGGAHERPA